MTPEEVLEMMGQGHTSRLAHITADGLHQYYVTTDQIRMMSDRTVIEILSTEIQSLPSVTMKKPPRNAAYQVTR